MTEERAPIKIWMIFTFIVHGANSKAATASFKCPLYLQVQFV